MNGTSQTVMMVKAPSVTGSQPERVLPVGGIANTVDGTSALLAALLLGLDDSNQQQRLRALAADIDNVTPENTPVLLGVMSRLSAFDGAEYDRLRTLASNSDAVTASVSGLLGVVARLAGFNGTTFDRLRTLVDSADDEASGVTGLLGVVSRLQAFDGSTFDRLRLGSIAELAGLTSGGALKTVAPGQWSVEHRPAAAAVATISRAMVLGGRNVCTSVTASVIATAAQGQVDVVLRDGATGAGTILWSARFAAAAGTSERIALSGLNIVGSDSTQMTLEFLAAPAATNFEGVAMTGYQVTS